MSRTRADLVNRVAKFLGKLIPGEALGAVEYQSIDDELDSIVANLNRRGFTYIPDIDDIEDELFDPLARIVTAKVCTDFSVVLANLPGFENEPLRSETELRVLGRETVTDDVIPFRIF